MQELAARCAEDFDDFYAGRKPVAGDPGDLVVLSCDGKGVVMRHDALRPATAASAAKASSKLNGRLSKGEKTNRKRLAEVGTVYDATPAPRVIADILPGNDEQRRDAAAGPATTSKWLTASVVNNAASVVGQVFDEAQRRDPGHARPWVALVDGNNHQIDRIRAEAKARKVTVSIVIDLIHVLEYLWKAPSAFGLMIPDNGRGAGRSMMTNGQVLPGGSTSFGSSPVGRHLCTRTRLAPSFAPFCAPAASRLFHEPTTRASQNWLMTCENTLVGCSWNSLTCADPTDLSKVPQIKRGSVHSRASEPNRTVQVTLGTPTYQIL